jgi:hypothetical protein
MGRVQAEEGKEVRSSQIEYRGLGSGKWKGGRREELKSETFVDLKVFVYV